MHAGNVFSALMCWLIVKSRGGRVVLRIDDLDVERSKHAFAEQCMRDFEALGLTWDEGPYHQQGRDDAYRAAFEALEAAGLVYPCFCTRADLRAASAPHRGEKAIYAGTCRNLNEQEVRERARARRPAWRVRVPEARFGLRDLVQGDFSQLLSRDCGDFVVRRTDGLFAYQLACVVDDAEEGVNVVVRGMDLLVSTPQQIYLQELLGVPTPDYAHVPLLVGERDRRLSKRDRDAGLDELLARYGSAAGVLGHIAYVAGLVEHDEPATCEELLGCFDIARLGTLFPDKVQILWR